MCMHVQSQHFEMGFLASGQRLGEAGRGTDGRDFGVHDIGRNGQHGHLARAELEELDGFQGDAEMSRFGHGD